ncbi:MAG: tetratricopeptide repeat protein [Ignavibacteriales bacterium]|nr:MAG: tetratricopeptide repeat protein [Ignavibacteriales bacterium]
MKTFTFLLTAFLLISITSEAQRRDSGNIRDGDGGRLDRVDNKPPTTIVQPPVKPTVPVYHDPTPVQSTPICYAPEPVIVEIIEVYPDPDCILYPPDESTNLDDILYLTIKQSAISNFNNEEYLLAINQLTDAINEDPLDAELFLYLGRCYIGINEYPDAIKNLSTSIKLDSLYDEAYYYRGLAKYYDGKRNEASIDLISARSLGNDQAAAILKKYFRM